MIDYQEIGNNIKICRIRCNLKQAELAEMVGVTSQHISHVERCQTKPSLTLLVDISTALRVDLYTLLGSNIPVHPDVSISDPTDLLCCIENAALEEVLNRISERDRYIFFSRALHGRSFHELALELDLGYQGVAAAYHRVCKKVKEATGRDVK